MALGQSLVFLDYKKEPHLFLSMITDMQHSYKVLLVIKGLPWEVLSSLDLFQPCAYSQEEEQTHCFQLNYSDE